MANQEHVDFLKQCIEKGEVGIEEWNKWREEHPDVIPDLSKANLRGAELEGINFSGANLSEVDLSYAAELAGANFKGAILNNTKLNGASLTGADLSDANLYLTSLNNANLVVADLRKARLIRADLRGADLARANLTNAHLMNCWVYGVSAWDVQLEGTKQSNLIITNYDKPKITVDNLEIAHFIYLLLDNQKIRQVIDTITSKVVLILGRFTSERKAVLDALRDELRNHNYSPIVFDFEKPASRDLTETVSALARLSRFIIADITNPTCVPQELYAVVPDCVVPVQPLLSSQPMFIDGKEEERRPYSMFKDLQRRYHWVLPTYHYQDTNQLLLSIKEHIITPAEEKGKELGRKKNGPI